MNIVGCRLYGVGCEWRTVRVENYLSCLMQLLITRRNYAERQGLVGKRFCLRLLCFHNLQLTTYYLMLNLISFPT